MRLLLEAPVAGMLARLAAPNVLGTLVMTGTTFADAWYVGQLGTAALASLALVFPFQTMMIMMCGGAIGGGVTSSLSRALGGGSQSGGEQIAWHGVLISALMAGVFMVVLGALSRPIFSVLGGAGEALDGAVGYAQIAFGGALVVWWMWTFSAILRGTGDTVTPARAVVVSGLAQIVLSGALTLGWGPFTAMGVTGPATAFIICHGLAALYLGWYLVSGRAGLRLRRRAFSWSPVADIMRVGGLGLINSLSIACTVAIVTGYIGRFGTEALAGYGLGSRLELMVVPISFGIGGALTVAVGANFGAGQYARARRAAWAGSLVSAALLGTVGVIAAIWPHLWLNLFTADATAYEFGAKYLWIVGPFYALFTMGQTLYFASQGTGRVGYPVLVGVLRLVVAAGFGAIALMQSWPIEMYFVGVALGMLVIGVGMALCMRSAAWCPDRV